MRFSLRSALLGAAWIASSIAAFQALLLGWEFHQHSYSGLAVLLYGNAVVAILICGVFGRR